MTSCIRQTRPRVSVSPALVSGAFAGQLLGRARSFCTFSFRHPFHKAGDDFSAQLSSTSKAPVPSSDPPDGFSWVWRDPVLLSALGASALIVLYQLVASLLKPPWLNAATDWLRAVLAWPQLLLLVLTSLWLTRTSRPGKISWWMFSIALFFYALAQTSWAILDQITYPHHVPFPYWDDLLYLLQYPCFFFALTLLPGARRHGQPGISRVKVIVDSLLLTAAGTALSWYFLLAPIYMLSAQPRLGKLVNLAYPVGDLVLLVGLSIVLTRWRHQIAERLSLHFLIAAVILLMIADSWYAHLNLLNQFQSGGPPDFFWIASYLTFALAGLVELRAARYQDAEARNTLDEMLPKAQLSSSLVRRARYFLPFVAAFLASIAIVGRALMAPGNRLSLLAPFGVSLGLLILVMIRQGITSLENERLLQEQEAAYANDLALREAARQMDEFLGIASHELKTPLTTIMLGLQMIQRRLEHLAGNVGMVDGKEGGEIASCNAILEYTFHHGRRLSRLVNDLLDTSKIRQGQLPLHQRPVELIAIVEEAVEEQYQSAPDRDILLCLPARSAVPIFADADRIGQVVTNYLTNALKYAPPGPPVTVGVQTESDHARVWVSDKGPGLSPEAQERLWERFHRVPGIEAQTDSGIGLGLGLHISKTIIKQHGGQVGVQSTPGVGSTFWFTLPLSSETSPCILS